MWAPKTKGGQDRPCPCPRNKSPNVNSYFLLLTLHGYQNIRYTEVTRSEGSGEDVCSETLFIFTPG